VLGCGDESARIGDEKTFHSLRHDFRERKDGDERAGNLSESKEALGSMKSQTEYLGIEIGATKLQVLRGTPQGSLLHATRVDSDAFGGADAIFEQIAGEISTHLAMGPVEAMGIGFGGPVDAQRGNVITSHQVPGWEQFPLVANLRRRFGLPCWLLNDSDAATVAEAKCGAGRGHACVFYTNIGSGIGAGLVKDGILYQGQFGGMEFGHTWAFSTRERSVDRLEHLCSGWGIASRYQKLRQALDPSSSPQGMTRETNAQVVVEKWLSGDTTATQIMDDVIETFGRALSSVIALVNPDKVVIGGGLSLVGAPLIDPIRVAVKRFEFAPFRENWTLSAAELGEMCVPIGACVYAASCA
jgi:glucokinase